VALSAGAARADFGQATVGMDIGPYKPAIDSETQADGSKIFPIYRCVFKDQNVVEVGGAVDTHLFDGFGSLQLTVGFGASQPQGHAKRLGTATDSSCGESTSTEVQLTFAKLRPGLTYRLDPLLDWVGFPLVPYGRAGLVLQGYMFTKNAKLDEGAVDPVGLRLGWEAAAGIMLALDFLDSVDPFVPDTTRRARSSGTFDHTFLYVEGAYQPVNGFGERGFVFTPVDTFLNTGLPVLWKIGVAIELL
jgi:hypothetical protein